MSLLHKEPHLLKPEAEPVKAASAPNLARSVSSTSSDEGVETDCDHPVLHVVESEPIIRRRKSHAGEDHVDCDVLRRSTSSESSSDDETDMRIAQNRLVSFRRWPLTYLSPTSLAVTGFYFTGVDDRVRCAYCQGTLAQWQFGDNPIHEHRRHFPNCPMSRREFIVETSGSGRIGEDVCGLNFNTRAAEEDDIFVPGMAQYRDRFATFANWPEDKTQGPRELAQAGLFFTGLADRVQCFHCGQLIERWDPQDDPWTEHAKFAPDCAYLLEKKGHAFVDNVRERFGLTSSSSSGVEEGPSSYTSSPPSRGSSYSEDSAMDDDDIEANLIAQAITQNCPSTLIVEALQERRKNTFSPRFRTAQEIVEAVREIENKKKLKAQLMENVQKEAVNPTKAASIPLTLEEENARMRQERRCKVCLDKDANTTLLPCQHAASCQSCAEKVSTCPVCRTPIERRLRVYFS